MRTSRYVSTSILLAIILVSMIPAQSIAELNRPYVGFSADENSYNITVTITGYNESLENVTASIYLKGTPTYFKFDADLDALTSNFTSLNITGSGYMNAEQINETITVETFNTLLVETLVNSSIFSMGSGDSGEYELLPLTISVDRLYTRTVQVGFNYTNSSFELAALFNLSKGLNYMPIPAPMPLQGDLALFVNINTESVRINDSIEFAMDLSLKSESGVQAADVILINMIYQMLSLYLTEDMIKQMLTSMGIEVDEITFDIGIPPNDPSMLVISLEFKGKLMQVEQQPLIGGMGQLPNIEYNLSGTSFTFMPVGEVFNSSASWAYNLTSYKVDESLYAVNLTVTAEGEASAPIMQGKPIELVEVNATIDNGYYYVEVYCSGNGNPLAAFYALLTIAKTTLESSLVDSIELDIKTQDISLLDTSSLPAQELAGTIILTKENVPESIGLAYDNTILSIEDNVLKATSTSPVEADMLLLASIEKAKIEAPGFIIKSPTPIIATNDFKLDIINGPEGAEINIYKQTVLSREAAFEIISRDDVSQKADEIGKRVIGTPLQVNGIINGTLEIGLSLDETISQGNIYILKIDPDGRTEIIENVRVDDGKAYFTASSFSIFVPVTDIEQTGGVVTTTTTTTTEETTTEETTTEETTKTTTTTYTETTEEEETTTTTETKEITTTETETETTTVEKTTPKEKTTTTTIGMTETEETEEKTEQTTTKEETTRKTTTQTTSEMRTEEKTTEETTRERTTEATGTTETTTSEEGGINLTLVAVAVIIIIAIIGAIMFIRR